MNDGAVPLADHLSRVGGGESNETTGDLDHSAITLVLRGDKLPHRNAIASCFNPDSQQLLVASAPILCLYGSLLELGGELLGVVTAEENIQFQSVVAIPWLHSYGVVTSNITRQIEFRVVSGDLSASCSTHIITENGAVFTVVVNPLRREILTSDTEGGFKVWVLRAIGRETPVAYKGFQRIHAGNRKSMYRRLLLTRDHQTILACTATRIHAFDSTTCARLGSFYKGPSSEIAAFAFDRQMQAIYIQRQDSPSHLHKLQAATTSRGRIHSFEKVGDHVEAQDIAAVEVIERGPVDESVPVFDGVLLLDSCGSLTIARCGASVSSSSSDNTHDQQQTRISLPLAPSAERYIAMHASTSLESPRNFVLVVCSSGILIVEIFLPITTTITTAATRRVITNVPGSRLTTLQAGGWRRIAILNASPPSLLLLHREIADDFYAMLLHHHQTSGQEAPSSVLEFAAIRDGLVVVWSCGDLTHYCFQKERTRTVGRITGHASAVLSTVFHDQAQAPLVFIGDDQGQVTVWSFSKDGEAQTISSKGLHNHRQVRWHPYSSQRVASLVNIDGDGSLQRETPLSILSASVDGEVKVWQLRVEETRVDWDLLVCFRTYASSISACALMGQEYLFCGSEDGGFECWRLPLLPRAASSEGRWRGGVAVLKKALHSIDLHLTRVCQVIVEPGDAAARVSAAPAHVEETAWVITYDLDQMLLIWCFSATFLFPHRKLKLQSSPTGGFLDMQMGGSFHLMVYIGRCLECLDILADRDKLAIKNRLRKAQRKLQDAAAGGHHHHHTPIANWMQEQTQTTTDSSIAPVRLRITLPTIEQQDALSEIEAARPHSPRRSSPSRPPVALASDHGLVVSDSSVGGPSSTITMDLTLEAAAVQEEDQDDLDVSTASAPSLPTNLAHVSQLVPATAQTKFQRKQRTSQSRGAASRVPTSLYAPENLPSQFAHAKPRVYKTNSSTTRGASTTGQGRCAVVTTAFAGAATPILNAVESEFAPCVPHVTQHESSIPLQDHVAIVTLTEEDLKNQFRLDFRSSGKSHKSRVASTDVSQAGANLQSQQIVLLPWASLPGEHQSVELIASTRARCVVQEAAVDEIAIPTTADFTSTNVKALLKVRVYSRWFLANQQGRQRIREAFLKEELQCAAQDGYVQSSLKRARCLAGVDTHDPLAANHKADFSAWYATGRTHHGANQHPPSSSFDHESLAMLAERLHERTAFLQRRLQAIDEMEAEQDGIVRYIFDPLPDLHATSAADSPSSWAKLSESSQRKELTVALLDPSVQMTAMLDDIALPDLAVATVDGIDLFTLAHDFLSWWSAPTNFHRSEFVKQEMKDAARDDAIRRIIQEEEEEENGGGQHRDLTEGRGGAKVFAEKYFRSDAARLAFLKNKLSQYMMKTRATSVAQYGKAPAPILFETPPTGFFIPFEFPAPTPIVVAVETKSELAMETLSTARCETNQQAAALTSRSSTTSEGDEDASRYEDELARMAQEDALSREFNDAYASESDDDHDGAGPEVIDAPKRTDFTSSYFFGNLPKKFRINAGGWLAGSGLDNGDEEIEEEERLDRERERQEALDRQEAERLADLERQAERSRIDKEKEEKAHHMRRLHQVELRKILAYQLELEQQRAEQNEHESMIKERCHMAEEERVVREWVATVERERLAMASEEKIAKAIHQAERDAKRAEMRRVLAELTQMDAEDRRSAAVQAAQLQKERRDKLRIEYLTELYEPFEPFFPDSRLPSEESLPALQYRLHSKPKFKQKSTPPVASYTLPFADALAMDDFDQEAYYVARDSRKLRQLLGLPVATSQGKKRMQIPSEREILQTRQALQLQLPPTDNKQDEERQEQACDGLGQWPTGVIPVARSNQADFREPRLSRLPQLVESSEGRLFDLATVDELEIDGVLHGGSPNQPHRSVRKRQAAKPKLPAVASSPSKRQQPPTTNLPFFRGNFIIKGEGKSRAQDYVPQ